MDARWGQFIFWAATIIAAVMVVFVVFTYAYNTSENYPVLPITPLLLAGVIWLAGWACRYGSR
jgi:hypothetical protein